MFIFLFFTLPFRPFAVEAHSTWRRMKAFSTLLDPDDAVLALRFEEQSLGGFGSLSSSEIRKQHSQPPHDFLLLEDSQMKIKDKSDAGGIYFNRRVSLYQRVPLREPYRFLGYIQSDLVSAPSHDQPYLVYHLQDAICGEDLSQTHFDPYLISYTIASHKLDQSERGSYRLLLSYNVKKDNLHWQRMLVSKGFLSWSSLDDDLQALTREVYKDKPFFHLGTQGWTWSTFFLIALP